MDTLGPLQFGEPDEPVEMPVLDGRFKANPYPFYERFGTRGRSVVPVRLPTGVEAWLVIGYAEARQLLKDPRLSKGAPHATARSNPSGTASHPLFRHLLTLDPPDHTKLRTIIAREFSIRRISLLRPGIEEVVNRLLDGIAIQDTADLVQDFALPLTLTVICNLIGIPSSDIALVQDWSARLAAADLDDVQRVPLIAEEIHGYLLNLAQQKRISGDDSLYSALLAAHDRGELTETELTAMVFLLMSAGHETTTSLIGNGVLALLREPSAWTRLCANRGVAVGAVEEVLRFESPLEVSTVRYATTEIRIGDALIRPGDRVFVGLAAANRNPGHFDRADEFDIQRDPPADHLAFGHGVHFCIGAALARAEGEIALAELARRFPNMVVNGDVHELEWIPGLILRGLRSLPVRFNP
ncbi:MAG: cytochrome P450 [Gammaproteobacteria bacterium]